MKQVAEQQRASSTLECVGVGAAVVRMFTQDGVGGERACIGV
jgi:hypothetical protein